MEIKMYSNHQGSTCGAGVYAVWPNVLQDLLGRPDRNYGYADYSRVATDGMTIPFGYGQVVSSPGSNISVPEGYLGHNPQLAGARSHLGGGEVECGDIVSTIQSIAGGGWTYLNGRPFRITEWYAVYSIPDDTPIALFEWEPGDGNAINFDASFESDQSREIDVTAPGNKRPVVSYDWDFGDEESGTGAKPTHTYDEEGEYVVTLTVTDDDSQTNSREATVTVEAARLTVTVTSETPEARRGEEITLVATVMNTGPETVFGVEALRQFSSVPDYADEYNVEGNQFSGPKIEPVPLTGDESPTENRPALAPGESMEVRRTYQVEGAGSYRLGLGQPFIPVEVEVTSSLLFVSGETPETDEVLVVDGCAENPCDNTTLIIPEKLDVTLEVFPADGERLKVGYGVYDTPAGGTQVGFGNAFGDRCRSGCIDLDLLVHDAATSGPVPDAANPVIRLSAPHIGGDGVVNPAEGGGVFCYDPGGAGNPVCGNPLELPKGVATGAEPQRIQYFLPGIVPGKLEEREVKVNVRASATGYEPFIKVLSHTAVPNMVIRRSRVLSESDLKAIKAAGLITAMTTGTYINANYATGIKALSDACKWIASKMPTLPGSMFEDEAGIKIGSTLYERACAKVESTVEEGIIQKIIADAVARQDELQLDRDYEGAYADATKFFAGVKSFNAYVAFIAGLPDVINVLWVANALDMSTAGLGRTTLSIELDPPKLNLGHASKFVSEVSAFAGELAVANIWSYSDVSYDLRIYEVSTAHPDGYPHEAIYLHFLVEYGGDRIEKKVLIDADYAPGIWLRDVQGGAREIRMDGPMDSGDTMLPASAAKTAVDTSFALGDIIIIEPGTELQETNQIIDVETRALARPIQFAHAAGAGVAVIGNLPVGNPPPPFTRFPFGEVDSDTLTLTWDEQPLASHYDLQVAEDSLFEHLVLDETGVTGTSFPAPESPEHEARFWRIRAHNLVGTSDWTWSERYVRSSTGTDSESESVFPDAYSLSANRPNPFSNQTTIRYSLPHATPVRLTVYDMMGREVARLVDATMQSGTHEAIWNASNVASGVYAYRIETPAFTTSRIMLFLK